MTLPIDRTALVAAQSNQVPNALIRSAQNIAAIQTPYDTIDELYNFTTGLISAESLSRLGVLNVLDYNASGLATTATGSITTGTKLLTLTTTPDFVAGQGINLQGIFEVASLEVTAGASSSANCTVTLNGTAKTVALTSGNTATQVATAIRAVTFPGWTTGGSGTTVTFTSLTTGTKTDASYSAGTTGATGTMTTTTQGTADQITTVASINGLVISIADNSTRTIAAGAIMHDDDASFTAALAAGDNIIVPAGTYIVSGTILSDNKKLATSGFSTLLKQRTGTAEGTRILTISGSNVIVGAMSYEGNITTDTGEQNHAVFIRPPSTNDITNIVVYGVDAVDIRGDGVYVGNNGSYQAKNVLVQNIKTRNMYRNGIAVTGGTNIKFQNGDIAQCGVFGIDVEADGFLSQARNVEFDNIVASTGAIIGLVGHIPEHITLRNVTIDRSLDTGSTPNYNANGAKGLIIRNSKNVICENVYITGFDSFGVYFQKDGSDVNSVDVSFNGLRIDNCSLTDTTYNTYIFGPGAERLTLDNFSGTLQASSKSFMWKGLGVVWNNGKITGGIGGVELDLHATNVEVSGGTTYNFTYLVAGSILEKCILSNTRFLGNSEAVVIDGCTVTWTDFKYNSGFSRHTEIDTKENTVLTVRAKSASMPSNGSWIKDDYVIKTTLSETGTASSKYIIKGWIRLTTGSGNVLNTDWFQDRALTGN